jgi:hypothetical protein
MGSAAAVSAGPAVIQAQTGFGLALAKLVGGKRTWGRISVAERLR